MNNKGHEKQTLRAKEEFRKWAIASTEEQGGGKPRGLLLVEVTCEYVTPSPRETAISHNQSWMTNANIHIHLNWNRMKAWPSVRCVRSVRLDTMSCVKEYCKVPGGHFAAHCLAVLFLTEHRERIFLTWLTNRYWEVTQVKFLESRLWSGD